MENLKQHIESLIFAAEQSISVKEIINCLNIVYNCQFQEEEILTIIEELSLKYNSNEYSFQLFELGGGYQFLTKQEYHNTIKVLLQQRAKRKLSTAAMETLSIIAYRQPVTKTVIEGIRGVNCDYSIQKLLEKELIAIMGKDDAPGKPLLYGTSNAFMDYFGIKSIKDLPKLKDIQEVQNVIGEPTE